MPGPILISGLPFKRLDIPEDLRKSSISQTMKAFNASFPYFLWAIGKLRARSNHQLFPFVFYSMCLCAFIINTISLFKNSYEY